MSAEATGYVYRHSPFKGAAFAVHHAVADSVNDQHHNEFFMSVGKLAKKARLSERAAQTGLRALEARGFLTRISEGKGQVYRYRFEFCPQAVVYESRGRSTFTPPPQTSASRGRSTFTQNPKKNPTEGAGASQTKDGVTFLPGSGRVENF